MYYKETKITSLTSAIFTTFATYFIYLFILTGVYLFSNNLIITFIISSLLLIIINYIFKNENDVIEENITVDNIRYLVTKKRSHTLNIEEIKEIKLLNDVSSNFQLFRLSCNEDVIVEKC